MAPEIKQYIGIFMSLTQTLLLNTLLTRAAIIVLLIIFPLVGFYLGIRYQQFSGQSDVLLTPTPPAIVQPSSMSNLGGESPTSTIPSDWLMYLDKAFNFTIAYPDTYFIKETSIDDTIPHLIHQVLFYDKNLANSDTATLQGPVFSIYLYENKANIPLTQWVENDELKKGGSSTVITLANMVGYKVELSQFIAPGIFYYVAHGSYVFKIVSLTQYENQMLSSLRFYNITVTSPEEAKAIQLATQAFNAKWGGIADGCSISEVKSTRKDSSGYFVTIEYGCGMKSNRSTKELHVSPDGSVQGVEESTPESANNELQFTQPLEAR